MTDFLIVMVVLVIIGAAVTYIVKEKKRGTRCIGCPAGGTCSHNGGKGCSGCGGHGENTCQCHTDTE